MTFLKTVAMIAAFAIGLVGTAQAGPDTNTTGGLAMDGTGLAMRGYDAVAYFVGVKPMIGSADHSATYNDATYRFSTAENLAKFKQDPAKYAPQFGG
ncbi:MAG: YHS domain-containing (seleno)protein, partial [Hyphomicrobiaceae bacterium]